MLVRSLSLVCLLAAGLAATAAAATAPSPPPPKKPPPPPPRCALLLRLRVRLRCDVKCHTHTFKRAASQHALQRSQARSTGRTSVVPSAARCRASAVRSTPEPRTTALRPTSAVSPAILALQLNLLTGSRIALSLSFGPGAHPWHPGAWALDCSDTTWPCTLLLDHWPVF